MTSRLARVCSRPRALLRLLPGLIFSLGFSAPSVASAQPRDPIDLEWTAPAECPSVDAVRARIRKLSGPRKPSPQSLRAEATITHNDEGGLHLRLLIRSGSLAGERNMDGKSCPALAGAAAVTLVLLLQSSEPLSESDLAGSSVAVANGGKTTANPASDAPANPQRDVSAKAASGAKSNEASAPAPAAPPAQQPASPRERDRDPHPARRWHVLLQLPQIELGLGPLHQPSFGFAIAGGASFDRWRFLAKGSFWLSQHAAASEAEQPYGADVDRMTATLLACRAAVVSWFELSPCVSLSVQHLSAHGTGAHVGGQTGTATWVAVGAGGQGRVRIAPWLNLFLGVDAQLQMSQPQLSVDEIGPVERLLPVALVTTLGSEWNF